MSINTNQDMMKYLYEALDKAKTVDDKFKVICRMLTIHVLLMDIIIMHVPAAQSSIENIKKEMEEAKEIMEH